MLRRLTGFYGRLPNSMIVAGDIEIGNDLLASGGFADVRLGKYMERLVAVKTLRVMGQEDLHKIRKVNFTNTMDSLYVTEMFCSSNFAKKPFSGGHSRTHMC